MFRNRTFNIAFLISISWHLFCMFCFTIVVLPVSLPMAKVSKVSFLGPILEKTAFDLMLNKKARPRRASYTESMRLDDAFLAHEEKGLDGLKFDNPFLQIVREDTSMSVGDLFGNFKVTPPFKQLILENRQEKATQPSSPGTRNENFVIEGPFASREILFKPDLPIITKKFDVSEESFMVELKFEVAPGGKIKEVLLLASSGYPDVDLTAINYIKGFQFSSLSSTGESVWGKLRLWLKTK
jgi:hypothetical protein